MYLIKLLFEDKNMKELMMNLPFSDISLVKFINTCSNSVEGKKKSIEEKYLQRNQESKR